jgi:hypothetical protein
MAAGAICCPNMNLRIDDQQGPDSNRRHTVTMQAAEPLRRLNLDARAVGHAQIISVHQVIPRVRRTP